VVKKKASVKEEPSELKTLVITFSEDGITPSFKFTGNWFGRNVWSIRGLLPRAYRQYQGSVRRSTTNEGETK